MLVPAAFVHLSIVDGPAASHAIRRELALAYHRSAATAGPDLVLLQVHETVERDPSLLVVTGWEALAPSHPPAHRAAQELHGRLVAAGGTARQFVGQAVAETPAI
jgi:hypothetical protein